MDHFFVGAARSRNGLFDFAWRKFFNRKTGETTPMELDEFIEKLDYEVKNKLK